MVNPEQPDEERSRKLRELEGKNIEHYSVMLAAYVASRSEINKAIFSFSVSAVGLLFTLAEKVRDEHFCIVAIYLLSIILFVLASVSSLFIFAAHSKALESYITQSKEEERKYRLNLYAYINYYAFGLGVITSVLAISAYVTKYFI